MIINWFYIAAFLLPAFLTLATTPVVKRVALAFGKVDFPSGRKVHQMPMVRLGGVAIFGAVTVSLFFLGTIFDFYAFLNANDQSLIALLLGSAGFFGIGLLDDLFDLSPLNRLWMQTFVASVVWCLGVRIDHFNLPGVGLFDLAWLSLPITTLWIAGVVNAINWMDGLDGLAAGVSAVVTTIWTILGVLSNQAVLVFFGLALLGSLIGFLYYNYNPAKIFMGDSGSYFIGFAIASLSIVGYSQLNSSLSVCLPLVVLAVPVGDMTVVILARLYQGNSPFFADNRHLHHRLLKRDFSHKGAVWTIYLLTLTTSSLAFVIVGVPHALTGWLMLLAFLSFVLIQTSLTAVSQTQKKDIIAETGTW